jgi:peptidoglycan/xylan/chitin deacetylase (PgdA/CDA1 family)
MPVLLGFKKIWKEKKIKQPLLSITFDDGYKSQVLASQISKKYGLPVTAYIMPRDIGKDKIINLSQLKEMHKSGWDIQSHFNEPLTWMSEKEIKAEMQFGINYINQNQVQSKTQHLAYPLGKHNALVVSTVKKYFKTARLAGGGIETLPPADLYRLRTYNVLNSTSPSEIQTAINKAIENQQWLILMFHYLKSSPETELEYKPDDFEKVCEIIKSSKIKAMTIDKVYQQFLK